MAVEAVGVVGQADGQVAELILAQGLGVVAGFESVEVGDGCAGPAAAEFAVAVDAAVAVVPHGPVVAFGGLAVALVGVGRHKSVDVIIAHMFCFGELDQGDSGQLRVVRDQARNGRGEHGGSPGTGTEIRAGTGIRAVTGACPYRWWWRDAAGRRRKGKEILGGELVDCTVMFSDIRDFTSLTEQMPPDKLVDLINHYMAAMVSVIVKHEGVVTRFGGDSILAVFGSPLNPMHDHADRAVASGIEMRQALVTFNQAELIAGRPTLENGIGIASGPVIAGNVGGKERIEYTVMGDAANLAARLEDMTKETGYPILLSNETYQALAEVPDVGARPLNDVRIKGKHKSVTVYALSA